MMPILRIDLLKKVSAPLTGPIQKSRTVYITAFFSLINFTQKNQFYVHKTCKMFMILKKPIKKTNVDFSGYINDVIRLVRRK